MNKSINLCLGMEYLCVYLLLLFKSGFYFSGSMSAITSMILLLLLFFAVMLRSRFSINKNSLIILFTMIGLYFLTEIATGSVMLSGNLEVYILFLINVLTSLLFISLIEYEDFKKIFCNVIIAISIASIVGWIVMKWVPHIVAIFPILTNPVGTKGHFALLTILVDYSHTGAIRGQGIFWEPGAFQTMIIIAMAMELFEGIEKTKWKRYLIYVVAGMLTFSTTGIVCIALMCALYVCKNRNSFLKLFVLLIGLVFLYIYLEEHTSGFLHYTLFRKLEGIFDYQVGVGSDASSRIDSIVLPLQAFLQSPVWGIGSAGYLELSGIVGHTMFTCTPVNYFAKFGIVFGCICFWGYWRLLNRKDMPLWKRLFVLGVLLLSVSTEEFSLNPLMICFILYGYQGKQDGTRAKVMEKVIR